MDLICHPAGGPMTHLKDISSWILSADDLDRLLHLVIATAVRAMDAKAGSLLLLDRKTRKLHFQVAIGEKRQQVKAYEVDLGRGIAGTVALTGTPLLIPDVEKDPRWDKEISRAINFKTRSIACAPMRLGASVIGVVQVIDKQDGSQLTDTDLNLLEIYADLAAAAIGNAQRIARMDHENKELRAALGINSRIIGESDIIKKVISDGLKVAESKTSVLITGESGTGKELLARLIHDAGPRKDKPLVTLNCAAVPEGLLEDELFGHERGAFTGAVSRKIGRFESADGGTIFLDEIGEMVPGMQAKLLRVVQEGVFYRVGGVSPIHVDVRVLSATNRNIEEDVAAGRFREDLFYRLNVVHLDLPPLRKRKSDIPLLCEHFLNGFRSELGLSNGGISQAAMEKILAYDWPGNVRELRNALERSVVMGSGRQIMPEDLPIEGSRPDYQGMEVGLTLQDAVNRFKKEFIAKTLTHTGGNRSRAAKIMAIQRTYLSRLVSKYGL